MLKKYDSFSKLRIVENILLEGYLRSTSDFLSIMKSMSNEEGTVGILADKIYDLINDEYWLDDSYLKQNHLGLTNNKDKVSFIMNDKVSGDLSDMDIDGLNKITRNSIKIGRLLRYLAELVDVTIQDKDIEKFVNIFKAKQDKNSNKMILVSGDDIAKYYKMDSSNRGSLGNSCMNGIDSSRFKVYTENKNIVRLLVYIDSDNKLLGRAIVWKLDKSPCEAEYFMDRIYTESDSDIYKFIDYAKENKWLYKEFQSCGIQYTPLFRYKGEKIVGVIKVKLENGDFDKFPYLDTLTFLNKKKTKLSNIPSRRCYMLHNFDSGKLERCEDCDGSLKKPHSNEYCYNCTIDIADVLRTNGIEFSID